MNKKWLWLIPLLAVVGWLARPLILNLFGINTTRVLVYNGSQEDAAFSLNGRSATLEPAQALVFKSSRFTNRLVHEHGEHETVITFKTGQYIINLGDAPLRVMEKYFPWNEEADKFVPYAKEPRDMLLFNQFLEKGITPIDDCWDCCILLPPRERPYRHLTPANKGKRFFVSSLL
ncbi:MAG: hypothetical protein AAF840_12270 [Bacteroidota bacterium]